MAERLLSETARRVPSSEDEVREELVKTVERTDIDFDRDTLRGSFSLWGATASYEWSLEADGAETLVTQRLSSDDWISIFVFLFFPVMALLSLTALVIGATDLSLTPTVIRGGTDPEREILRWPMYAFISFSYILLSASVLPFLWVVRIPSPLDRFEESQWEYTAGLAAVLGAVAVVFSILCISFSLFFMFSTKTIVKNTGVVIFGFFLSGAVPTVALFQLERQDQLETVRFDRTLLSWRQQPDDESTVTISGIVGSFLKMSRLYSSETDELKIPYRSVEAGFGKGRFDAAIESVREGADSVGINVDPDLSSMDADRWIDGGETKEFTMRGRYQWNVSRLNEDNGVSGVVVEETLYVSATVLSSLQFAALTAAGVLTLITVGDPLPPLPFDASLATTTAYIALIFFAFPLYANMLLYVAIRPKNLPIGLNLDESGSRLRKKRRQMEPFVGATTIFAIGGVLSNLFTFPFQTVVSASFIAGLLAVAVLAEVRYESVGKWIDSVPISYPTPPFGDSLASAFYIAFPAIQLLVLIELPEIVDETARATTVALTTLLAVVTLSRESYFGLGESVAKFESRGEGDHPFRSWTLYTVSVATSVGSIALAAFTAKMQAETARSTAEMMFYVGPSLLLVGFPLLGVVYQIGSKALTLHSLFEHSHRVDPETVGIGPETVGAELRLFDGPVGTSTGVTLRDGVVFLSRGDAELLDPPELAALLAHEDAHATRYADGRLSVLAPLIAAVTLTGQNLLLAALDFRGREFRADDYAADTTSPRQVRRALSEVHAERHSPNSEKAGDAGRVDASGPHVVPGPAFGSFRPPESELSVLQRLFGTIYGGFTISRAHPSVEARIDRLRQREREEE